MRAPGLNGQSEFEFALVQIRDLAQIRPAPENNDVYQAIDWADSEVQDLARSIREHGVQEPLLISRDGYIISGHRRRVAALQAGLDKVPVRIHPISREQNPEGFLKLLVEMNAQRIKSAATLLRESVIKTDAKEAHQQIVNERLKKQEERALNFFFDMFSDDGRRATISEAKTEFLQAILRVLEEQRAYWPLSDRQIHYRLLGPSAPLTHSSKADSRYRNDISSYRKLTDLLTRGRIAGLIPWQAIDDETRPVDTNRAFRNPAEFFREQLGDFLKGYWRNRQQSQPDHIEIIGEKLTVRSILQPVAEVFTIPLTITRGMSSLPPKKAIHARYLCSQKERLALLIVTDLDPAGEAIFEDLAKSFRRDFGVTNIEPIKVALRIDHVEEFALEPSMEAKESSPTYQSFVDTYDITDAYELEAMAPADLAQTLDDAIMEVIDVDAYNQELAAEEADSAKIIAVRQQTEAFFKSLKIEPT